MRDPARTAFDAVLCGGLRFARSVQYRLPAGTHIAPPREEEAGVHRATQHYARTMDILLGRVARRYKDLDTDAGA